MNLSSKPRIESIDVVRGIAMVIMALDHVRDHMHISAFTDDPLNLETTTPLLFFTRWITHLCAPIFVFLSGTSIFLQSQRKTRKELGAFLIKRGLWLIVAEWTIIALAWSFDITFGLIPFQVIWAIGISMVLMGLMILLRFSYRLLLIIGIILFAGHNLLDFPESAPGFTSNFWWDLLHHGHFTMYEIVPGHVAMIVYPFPAWTGVMLLGYCAGIFFTQKYSQAKRSTILSRIGIGLIVLFILVRFTNAYGDPLDWNEQKNSLFTFFSFINTTKYPPSLLYLCITIGPSLIILAWIEKFKNRFTDVMSIFGRTAFFYYITHLYLIHIISAIVFFARGNSFDFAMELGEKLPFLFIIPGVGFGLGPVYLIWISVVIILYPVCKKYDEYKLKHREKWWLSYL